MSRTFNITADCKPSLHYMVDITDRLEQIKKMIDAGQYFTINRARQYGKTTILRALAKYLVQDYVVVSLDFLSQLRGYYIDRDVTPAFQSVILAGVYDIKNIKEKFGLTRITRIIALGICAKATRKMRACSHLTTARGIIRSLLLMILRQSFALI